MSEYTYQYSIISDITAQSLNSNVLHKTITNTLTNTLFKGININGDTLTIVFESPLESADVSTLTILILNHNPASVPDRITKMTMNPVLSSVSNVYYTSIGSIIYAGKTKVRPFTAIDLLSKMDSGAISYTAQVINRNNNTLIAEHTFYNSSIQICTFDTINVDNLPEDVGAIEVMIKIENNTSLVKNVYIYQIAFWLD